MNIQTMKTVNVEKNQLIIEKCTENVEETMLTSAENEHKCSSCTVIVDILFILYNKHWNWYLFHLLQISELQ